MLDGFTVVFFALVGALPAGLVAYRHGYWKGMQAGRRDVLDRLPAADALAILQGVPRDTVAVDALARFGADFDSPAPLAGVGGIAGGAGPDVPMLTDEGGGTGARPVSQTPLDTDTPIR